MGTMLVSENEPPIADFTWMPSNPAQNQVVFFNGSLSYDPDGSINLFEWDWNNDGIFDESYNYSTVKHKWTKTGNYPIVLRVTDNDGVKSTKTINISVSAGDKTPGFEIILMLVGFIFILYWKRKKY
jgi:PKD repeat protein